MNPTNGHFAGALDRLASNRNACVKPAAFDAPDGPLLWTEGVWWDAQAIRVGWRGEIVDAAGLRNEPVEPASASDAGLLAAAWRRWGSRCLQYLNGTFAFALSLGDEVILGRDPSGHYSLYWHEGADGRITFGSHPYRVLRIAGADARIGRDSLHEYLRFLDIAPPNTLFQSLHAVEPGQIVQWGASGMCTHDWPVADNASPYSDSFPSAIDRLDEKLQHGVAACLADSSRPAAFLSGGIDSSLICALASRRNKAITAVTVGFDKPSFDEAPVAQRIAAHLGIPHQVLRFSREEYLSAFDRLSRELEQPTADPATPATLLAFDHCRKHFDTVLDGTGADEAVGAMPPRYVRLAVGYASMIPVNVRYRLEKLLRASPHLSGYAPIVDFEHPADTMIRWRGFTRLEIEELCGEPVSFASTSFYRAFTRFPRSAHYQRYSALLDTMPSDRLSAASLISGMPVRFPFFDGEANAFIRQLPTDYRYLPGEAKRILRALLARYVPRQIWDLPKHGFDFPLQQFLSTDDHALVHRYLVTGRWLDRGLLRPDLVRSYARRFMAGDTRLAFRVWALLVLGAWLEKHEQLR